MSAVEVIEQFKSLPPDAVDEFLHLRLLAVATSTPKSERKVDDDFKEIADHVFTKNAELFRKLAQ